MPVDQKRINGPEITKPFKLYTKTNVLNPLLVIDLLKSGSRVDGRTLKEHRKIAIKTNVITKATGSAYIEQGNTQVVVSVYGPKEIPNKTEYSSKGVLSCEFKYAPFSCHKRKLHQQDTDEIMFSMMLKKALEPSICLHNFPNFQITVHAVVMHNDGSALSAAVNAAGVAIASAGIPMFDSVTCLNLAAIGEIELIDPTYDEEVLCLEGSEGKHSYLTMAYLQTRQQISLFNHVGYLSSHDVINSYKKLTEISQKMVPLIHHIINTDLTDAEDNSVDDMDLNEIVILHENLNICESESESPDDTIETIESDENNSFVEIIELADTDKSIEIIEEKCY